MGDATSNKGKKFKKRLTDLSKEKGLPVEETGESKTPEGEGAPVSEEHIDEIVNGTEHSPDINGEKGITPEKDGDEGRPKTPTYPKRPSRRKWYIVGAGVIGLAALATYLGIRGCGPSSYERLIQEGVPAGSISEPIYQETPTTKKVPRDIGYEVKKGDRLWDIVKKNYNLKTDKEIAAKVNEVAKYNAERGLKSLLVDNRAIQAGCNNVLNKADGVKGDYIKAGTKITLPGILVEVPTTQKVQVGTKYIITSKGDTTYVFAIDDKTAPVVQEMLKGKQLDPIGVTTRTDTTKVPQYSYSTRVDTSETYVPVKKGNTLWALTKSMYKDLNSNKAIAARVNEVARDNAERAEALGNEPKGKSHFRWDTYSYAPELGGRIYRPDGIKADIIYADKDTVAFRVTKSVVDSVKTGDRIYVKTFADTSYIALPNGDIIEVKGSVPTAIDSLFIHVATPEDTTAKSTASLETTTKQEYAKKPDLAALRSALKQYPLLTV